MIIVGTPNISLTMSMTNKQASTAIDIKKAETTSELTELSTHLLVTVVTRSTDWPLGSW